MKPLALSCAALFGAALCSAALSAPLQVQTSTMQLPPGAPKDLPTAGGGWADGSIRMPVVTAPVPAIARRINETLFLTLLGMPAPLKAGSTFTPPDGVLPRGTSSVEFKATRNDGRVLTIGVEAEGCGAYCETASTRFNFDATTGRALALEELFTPAGLAGLAQRMRKERARRYGAQVRELEKTLAGQRGHAKADEIEDTQDRIALNADCLAGLKARAAEDDATPTFDFALPADRGLVITAGRCSNHASRALDDVDAVSLAVAPADLRPLLTPYGKALVLGVGDALAPVSPFGQILHGKVGNAPVTLQLDRPQDKDSIGGLYYYDKYRHPIRIFGTRKGALLELKEEGDDAGTLVLTVRGMAAAGQWEGKNRRVPVTLAW